MVLRSLKTKILLIVIIAVVVIEVVFLTLNILSLSRQIRFKTEEEAFNLSETIRSEHSQCHDQRSKRRISENH